VGVEEGVQIMGQVTGIIIIVVAFFILGVIIKVFEYVNSGKDK